MFTKLFSGPATCPCLSLRLPVEEEEKRRKKPDSLPYY